MSTVESLTLKGGPAAGGTLLWELAKSVYRQHGEMNPAVGTILSLVAANMFEALADEQSR